MENVRCRLKSDKSFTDYIKGGGAAKIIPIIILGIVLILFGSGIGGEREESVSVGAEDKLCQMLSSVEGVGRCKVMINESEDGEVYAVAVLCDGAGHAKVRERVVSLIRSMYGIGANRVSVLPYVQQGTDT